MNHEDYIKKRDEILEHMGVGWCGNPFCDKPTLTLTEAAQAIDALVLDVIGKDATTAQLLADNYRIYEAEDKLRYEQRRIVQGDES